MKKLIAVLLAAAMLLSLLPMAVFAYDEEETEEVCLPVSKLYVGTVNALETPQGDGWSFDAATNTLTLNNCALSESMLHVQTDEYGTDRTDAMIYVEGDLTIELIGTNSVERVIEDEPTDYTQYYAIVAAIYETDVNGEVWDYPSKLSFTGSGNLTVGIAVTADAFDAENWTMVGGWEEYLEFSAAIGCWDEGSAELTGLQSGAWMDIYGGVYGMEAPYLLRAFACSPTFGDNCIVTAYRDVEGTIENESGYNWNNNDAWRMKVVTGDACLKSNGQLILMDSGSAAGEGWSWENRVLTLEAASEVRAVVFRQGLGSATLALAGDVTLDNTDLGYDSDWNSYSCIDAHCDLQIDAAGHTLTFLGSACSITSYCADVTLTNGTFDDSAPDSYGIQIGGGSLTVTNATLLCAQGIYISDGYDADWNTVPAGDVRFENAVVTLGGSIDGYGDQILVLDSVLTVTNGYTSLYAPNGIYLKDSAISLTASGTAIDTNETVIIDNCDLNITAETAVISCGYVSYDDPDEPADPTKLSLLNMDITQPAAYQIIAVEGSWGSKNVMLANSDGTVATTLIATATVKDTACSHSYGSWQIITPATLQTPGQQQKVCGLCGDTVTEAIPCLAGDVEGWNLALGDDLSVSFKLAIAPDIRDTAQIVITVADSTVRYSVSSLTADTDGSYLVSANVSAPQMGQAITVQIVNGEDASVTKTYSVLQYAQAVLADETLTQYHQLVKEMLNYGAAAQLYFNYDTENLVNAGIAGAGQIPVDPNAAVLPDIRDNDSNIDVYAATLVLREKVAIRYYFNVYGDPADYIFLANGEACEPIRAGDRYYVEIADINPQDLDNTLWVSAGDAYISYSPMNYIVRMSQSSNTALQELTQALYNYHLAAEALCPG